MIGAVGLSVACVVLSVLLQFEMIGWLWRAQCWAWFAHSGEDCALGLLPDWTPSPENSVRRWLSHR